MARTLERRIAPTYLRWAAHMISTNQFTLVR
jgi:hypothetical protein